MRSAAVAVCWWSFVMVDLSAVAVPVVVAAAVGMLFELWQCWMLVGVEQLVRTVAVVDDDVDDGEQWPVVVAAAVVVASCSLLVVADVERWAELV